MAPFLCRVLDEYDLPLPSVIVTIRPPSRQGLTAITCRDGFAGIWALPGDSIEPHFIHPGEFPVFVLTFNLSATPSQPPWPPIHAEVHLAAMPHCCVVLSLRHGNTYRLQYISLPDPSKST